MKAGNIKQRKAPDEGSFFCLKAGGFPLIVEICGWILFEKETFVRYNKKGGDQADYITMYRFTC
jgi:hypothetical protein